MPVPQHLEEFLRASKEGGGGPLPRFVERALRAYLACGLRSHELRLREARKLDVDRKALMKVIEAAWEE